MADLKNPKLIYLKGFLFLFLGLFASALLLLEHPELKVALLLAAAVWGFARFYYFAFYVIEHYVDPGYRFAGLWSFVRYLAGRRPPSDPPPPPERGAEGQSLSPPQSSVGWLEPGMPREERGEVPREGSS